MPKKKPPERREVASSASTDTFRSHLATREAPTRAIQTQPAKGLPKLVGIDVLADRSGYKATSIRNMVSRGRSIGALAFRVSGRLRWRIDDVERWLAGELDG